MLILIAKIVRDVTVFPRFETLNANRPKQATQNYVDMNTFCQEGEKLIANIQTALPY